MQGTNETCIPSSTTSPTNTLAIPAMAMTTLGDTVVPVMDCINCNKYLIKYLKKISGVDISCLTTMCYVRS